MDNISKKCLICETVISRPTHVGVSIAFNKHVKIHGGIKKYYDMYFKKEMDGKCIICGKETRFINFKLGYHPYCTGNNCGQKSGVTLSNFIRLYGEVEGKKIYDELSRKNSNSKSLHGYIERYGEVEGREIWEEKQKNNSFRQTLDGYIERYGEVEGKKKWEEKKDKCGRKNSLKSLILEHGEVEGREIWEERKIKNKKSRTLESFVDRYGEVEGKKKWEDWKHSSRTAATFDGYIERYGEVEGKKKWEERRERMSYCNSVQHFIDKYGEEGRNKWKLKTFKNTLDAYIEKYGVEIGTFKFKERLKKIVEKRKFGVSEVSMELFQQLNWLNSLYGRENEYKIYLNERYYSYDFTDLESKKIIEFNGDYWHASPLIYEAEEWIKYPGEVKQAKDIWQRDTEKNELIKSQGFDVLVIWESEYRNDKERTIQKCLKFLKDGKP